MCKNDLIHWVNTWCWTYDPRVLMTLPFDLFPRQVEFLHWLREMEDAGTPGIAEKSRDVGYTWLSCAYDVHSWLFRPGYSAGYGSRKLELVDKSDDPKCIFDKLRRLIKGLPRWMLPKGFDFDKHMRYCNIINPETGANITGEGGDDIGRGGRTTRYTVDEYAFVEHPQSVDGALANNTNCRILMSTPNRPGDQFCTKRFSRNFAIFTFHWMDDPRRNHYEIQDADGNVLAIGNGKVHDAPAGSKVVYPWYVKYCAENDAVTVAREIDLDYSASTEGICIPAIYVRAAVNLIEQPRFKQLYPDYKPQGELIAGLDVSDEGKNRNVFTPRRGIVVEEPVAWGGINTTQTAWKARDEADKRGVKVINYDPIGVGAGVKGTWNSTTGPLSFKAVPVNVGVPPSDARWESGKTSKEMFANLKAELWWMVRARCERAYEFVEDIKDHPAEDMISLPDCQELIAQLSMPLVETTDRGLIKMESKPQMQKRGVASPDYADSLILTEHPQPYVPKWEVG